MTVEKIGFYIKDDLAAVKNPNFVPNPFSNLHVIIMFKRHDEQWIRMEEENTEWDNGTYQAANTILALQLNNMLSDNDEEN